MLAEIIWNKDTIMWVMLFGVPIVGIICGTWYKVERTKSMNYLKRSMVEKGMSAADIERVMSAKPPKD